MSRVKCSRKRRLSEHDGNGIDEGGEILSSIWDKKQDRPRKRCDYVRDSLNTINCNQRCKVETWKGRDFLVPFTETAIAVCLGLLNVENFVHIRLRQHCVHLDKDEPG